MKLGEIGAGSDMRYEKERWLSIRSRTVLI